MNFHYARYENVKKSVPPKFKNEASDHLNDVTTAPFSVSFSQLPAVKKDTENCAPGNFFGPSYFVTTLISKQRN